ncbi:hypothetical protein CLOP_g24952 [Closterium sp. NIES-67]|nr:hypothetical protein CLOP_g24952 [Closterium sp. NIES-67]
MAGRSGPCSRRLSQSYFSAFLISLLISDISIIAYAGASENDVRALLDVREAIKEANPSALESWSEFTDPCGGGWEGKFLCDNDGHVTFMSLLQLNLQGPIPGVQLAALTSLNHIDLGSNSFTGTIPEQLLRLTSLLHLSLSYNKLSGPLPGGLSQLKGLQQLRLAGNQLSGELPASLSSLSNLTLLNLCKNQFTGPLPADWSRMTQMATLRLSSNQLSGDVPSWLGSWRSLVVLELFSNKLTGYIPQDLAQATTLVSLALDVNELHGSLPDAFSRLTNLKELYMAGNKLEGSIPASYSALTQLRFIDVSYNAGLGGTIPAFLGDFEKLESIAMQFCSFTGPLPPELSNLAHLQELLLDNNALQGAIPDSWGTGLERVAVLHLNDNRLSGAIPGTFCHLEYAKDVNLALNMLSGPIPICLTSLRRISSLVLSFNRLTGPVPPVPAGVQVFFKVNGNCLDGVEDQQSPCPAPDDTSSADVAPPTTGEQPEQQEDTQGSSSTWSWMRGFLIALLSATFVLLLIFAFVLLANRGDSHNPSGSENLAVQEFSLSKIKKATRSFTTVYGKGSFGTVYLAEDFLRDQIETRAIIKRAHDPEKLGEYLFKSKADFLARVRHRSLVALLGFCVGKGERILVYEYLPNGSLYDRLHRPDLEPIPWDTRVRIAANVASALNYLHHCCHPPLVHRAVTSSNILLTFDMSGKLSDFGLARGGSPAVFDDGSKRRRPAKPVRTRSGGVAEGEGSEGGEGGEEGQSVLQGPDLEKVDVYGFGVVLLELITGQKAMKEVHITSLAAPFLEDAQMMPLMVDAALGGFFDQAELIQLGTIARDCVKEEPSARPSMRDVVRTMQAKLDLEAELFAAPAGATGMDDLERGEGGVGPTNSSGYARVDGKSALASAWVSLENVASSVRSVLTSPRLTSPHPAGTNESTTDPTDVEMSSLLLIAPRAARR